MKTNIFAKLAVFFAVTGATSLATATAQQNVTPGIPLEADFVWQVLKNDTILNGISPQFRSIYTAPYMPLAYGQRPGYSPFNVTTFAPLVFDVDKLLSLTMPEDTIRNIVQMKNRSLFEEATTRSNTIEELSSDWHKRTSFWENQEMYKAGMALREHIFRTQPDLVRGTTASLPKRKQESTIRGREYHGQLEVATDDNRILSNVDIAQKKVAPKYWFNDFQADMHFAQNQVSSNWHRGGHSSLNLNGRAFYSLTYNKEKVKWVNTMEYKLGIFTQTAHERMKFQIGEDVFRAGSNLGLEAWRNWYYTIDVSLRSQLMNNYTPDSVLTTRAFAPLMLDAGIGIKYDIDKKKFMGNPFSRFRFSANVAPASVQLVYTWSNEIDKKRIGLKEGEKLRFRLGSSARMDLSWDFTSYLTWTSRVLYITSYKHVETEFENTLSYSFNKYLSAKVNLNLRYDDSVILNEPKTFRNLLQYNELFSFGLTYRI